jgi:hypothetical protein
VSYSFGTSKGEVLPRSGFQARKVRVIEAERSSSRTLPGQNVTYRRKEFDADEVLLHSILTKAAGDVRLSWNFWARTT